MQLKKQLNEYFWDNLGGEMGETFYNFCIFLKDAVDTTDSYRSQFLCEAFFRETVNLVKPIPGRSSAVTIERFFIRLEALKRNLIENKVSTEIFDEVERYGWLNFSKALVTEVA